MITNQREHTDLLTSDFYYDLPEELIAQHPSEVRDMSRLMVLDRETDNIEHRRFHDITEYLREGDVLVVNDSKVIPARLYGHAEVLLWIDLYNHSLDLVAYVILLKLFIHILYKLLLEIALVDKSLDSFLNLYKQAELCLG